MRLRCLEQIKNVRNMSTTKRVESSKLVGRYMRINVGHNKKPEIYKDLAHITFPNLKTLSLRENFIVSLEGFHRMRLPELSELFLSKF